MDNDKKISTASGRKSGFSLTEPHIDLEQSNKIHKMIH